MTLLSLVGLALAAGTPDGDLPRPEELKAVEERVRGILRQEFGGLLTDAALAAQAPRLALPIARAQPAEWRTRLLEELPAMVRFHRGLLDWTLSPIGIEGVPEFVPPREDVDEGVGIELSYIAARVDRAARRRITPELRKKVDEQVDRLMGEGARLVLASAGDGDAPGRAQREFDTLAGVYKRCLDAPYQACLDRALSESELGQVLAEMRRKAEDPATRSDPVAALGAVYQAALGAGRLCMRDFKPWQERSNRWRKVQREKRNDWLRAHGVRVEK
jgi:hypothetical protein